MRQFGLDIGSGTNSSAFSRRKEEVSVSEVLQRRFPPCVSQELGSSAVRNLSASALQLGTDLPASAPLPTRAGCRGATPGFPERGIRTLSAALLKWPWALETSSELTANDLFYEVNSFFLSSLKSCASFPQGKKCQHMKEEGKLIGLQSWRFGERWDKVRVSVLTCSQAVQQTCFTSHMQTPLLRFIPKYQIRPKVIKF